MLKAIRNIFNNRSKEWDAQLSFIEDLAKANDIDFDRTNFKRPRRKIRHFRLYWPQSDAAEYIAQKLYEKRLEDPMFFKPWAAAWLPIDRKTYEDFPFYHVRIIKLPDSDFQVPGELYVFAISSIPGQDIWLQEDSKYKIMPMCKTCHHKWNHYPSFKIKSGEYQNPQDTVQIKTKEGKVVERLICPICHSMDIYKTGHMLMRETFDFERFVFAQEGTYASALSEIRNGRKRSDWIWYIFPQIKGLGFSRNSHFYGLMGADEAKEYLRHPILGRRLREITAALLALNDKRIDEIFSDIDAKKVRSSMTLFDAISPNDIFDAVLSKYFNGERDPLSLDKIIL